MQQLIDTIFFHENANSPSTGLVYFTTNASAINIEFETNGTFSATFEAKVNPSSSIWKRVTSTDLDTINLSSTVTDATKIYQIDTTGLSMIRVNLTSVSGTISVYGKVVG